MAHKLVVTAKNWRGKAVACSFTATADSTALGPSIAGQPVFEIYPGISAMTLTATPTSKPSTYWPKTINLSVSGNRVSPKPDSQAFVTVTAASGPSKGITQVSIKLSRFKDVTSQVLGLLRTPPTTRKNRPANDAKGLKQQYGAWPPGKWEIKPAPKAHFINVTAPVTAAGDAFDFAKGSPAVQVDSLVLELAGVPAPRLYGVVWPKAIAPRKDAPPTPIFLFFRQTCGQDVKYGIFTGGQLGPYPYNFDYAERCLFESLHYGDTPLSLPVAWSLRPKGVPYQVAKAGASVVTVFPVASVGPEYGVLADTEQTGKILEELQAYMFWRAGIADPPGSVGNTAIAAFSSANYELRKWLESPANRKGAFLSQTVRAIYFLDPPTAAIDPCITAALTWAKGAGSDKRIRLYSRVSTSSHQKLLGAQPPPEPYVENSSNKRHTAAVLLLGSWDKTFKNVVNLNTTFAWWDAHHFIAATMLTHALAQGDI